MATQARASLQAGWKAADGPKGTEYPELQVLKSTARKVRGARSLSFISEGASTGRSEAVPASALPLETRDAKGGSRALSFSPPSVLKFWSEERKQSGAQLRAKTRKEE